MGSGDLDDFLAERRKEDASADITPWFRLLKERKLDQWWSHLIEHGSFPESNANKHIERFV